MIAFRTNRWEAICEGDGWYWGEQSAAWYHQDDLKGRPYRWNEELQGFCYTNNEGELVRYKENQLHNSTGESN